MAGYSRGMDAPFQKWHLSANMEMSLNHTPKRVSKMKITTIGADLAKSVIQIHAVDSHGNTVLRKQLKRSQWHRGQVRIQTRSGQ